MFGLNCSRLVLKEYMFDGKERSCHSARQHSSSSSAPFDCAAPERLLGRPESWPRGLTEAQSELFARPIIPTRREGIKNYAPGPGKQYREARLMEE
jgi:hypothetical protein